MRRILALSLLVSLCACEKDRKGIPCYGLNGEPREGVKYEYSTTNIVVGIFGAETIVIPVVVVLNELNCPVVR